MVFKKQINILLTFFLLVSNLGLAFNVHYCDDQIASISINNTSSSHEIEKDCCGVVEKDSKCCKNKIVKVSEKIDQVLGKSFSYSPDFYLIQEVNEICFFEVKNNFKKCGIPTYYCDANAPPLFLLYSQYTFYA